MSRDRAAYMREYRARKARIVRDNGQSARLQDLTRIVELEEEVARLKRELAARPALGTFNSRPFTPVPKRR